MDIKKVTFTVKALVQYDDLYYLKGLNLAGFHLPGQRYKIFGNEVYLL